MGNEQPPTHFCKRTLTLPQKSLYSFLCGRRFGQRAAMLQADRSTARLLSAPRLHGSKGSLNGLSSKPRLEHNL